MKFNTHNIAWRNSSIYDQIYVTGCTKSYSSSTEQWLARGSPTLIDAFNLLLYDSGTPGFISGNIQDGSTVFKRFVQNSVMKASDSTAAKLRALFIH